MILVKSKSAFSVEKYGHLGHVATSIALLLEIRDSVDMGYHVLDHMEINFNYFELTTATRLLFINRL